MFGVCYYPEHWPRSFWPRDAEAMAELGLQFVRIGEFAWSRLEPRRGEFDFEWLDDVVELLAAAGLRIVMCTPTATPPKWLIDRWPEVLPVDPLTGRTRGFGSRRHYDFSSEAYLSEALRISETVASRYGRHDAVVGWQTDNEFCCHDTALSASRDALRAFRRWCEERYRTVDALNEAWGNVFWSMEYRDFAEIEHPFGAVTETNPAHRLAYQRFSSAQVARFHQRMVEIIRKHAPGRFVTHNFIPMSETGVDNFELAAPLDFASYDNYPLGRSDLQFREAPEDVFRKYMRTGHPDLAAYYLDQTRCLSGTGFWVMEQQPGPVNWAPNNPRPAPGMVRLWTLEAFAHGADCVSYFRWRQAPFAQEQMHAGLLRPDSSRASGWPEVGQAIAEARTLDLRSHEKGKARVAIVTSPESFWVSSIERQSQSYAFNDVQFDYYRALRSLGLGVDFITMRADPGDYALVVAPSLPVLEESFVDACAKAGSLVVFGPRSGAKTPEFQLPPELPPGPLQRLLPVRVLSVETLRADCPERLLWNGREYRSTVWREELEAPGAEIIARSGPDAAAVVRHGRALYLGTLTCLDFLRDFFRSLCDELQIDTIDLPDDLRIERRGDLVFAFNYSATEQPLPLDDDARVLLGHRQVGPHDVTVWTR